MIRYYINAGDERGSEMFTPYVWKDSGLGTLIKSGLEEKKYGVDLNLLLIQYYVAGEFSRYLPEEPKVSNYSTKNKDISVAIGVPSTLFHDRNEFERRVFVIDTTLNAIKLVKVKLEKKKLDIDFSKLIQDITHLGDQYLMKKDNYF